MRVFGLLVLVLWLGSLWAQTPIRSVQVEGVSVAPPEQVGASLYALIGTAPTDEQLRAALEAVEAWYRQRGYTLARVVDYTLNESGALTVQVAEGVIERIEVRGNTRTRTEVLRRLLGVRPGEVYNEERLQRVRQRIGRFPFLRDAKLGAEPGEQVGATNLLLQVEEEQSLDFAVAAGYSSEQGFVGYAELIETNVGGLGHRARIQWQREQVRNPLTGEYEALRPSYSLSYEAPRALPGAFNFGVELYDRAPFYPVFYADIDTVRRYERRRGVAGVASEDAPLSELFWAGGYDLLRGYAQDEFRGNRLVVGSAEYLFPVLEAVQAAVFVDVGAVWSSGTSLSSVPVRTGVGAGLRFASPIGLIRFDLAYGKRGFVYLSLAGVY